MNKYLKAFIHRGLIFGGFGPIVVGIVYLILSRTIEGFSLGGGEVFTAIISTYLLAFVHAGASVFNQIEHWSPSRSIAVHMSVLCAAYVFCYLVNSWIWFDWRYVLIFIAIFTVTYLVIYAIVVICIHCAGKRLNKDLKRNI